MNQSTKDDNLCTMFRDSRRGGGKASCLLSALRCSSLLLCDLLRDEEVRARRELGLGADPRPIAIEQEWARREEHAAEADERARPVDAQPLEHLHGEERERCADRGTDDRVRGERGRAVLQVRVDEVRLCSGAGLCQLPVSLRRSEGGETYQEGVEDERHADTKRDRREGGHDPVDA